MSSKSHKNSHVSAFVRVIDFWNQLHSMPLLSRSAIVRTHISYFRSRVHVRAQIDFLWYGPALCGSLLTSGVIRVMFQYLDLLMDRWRNLRGIDSPAA